MIFWARGRCSVPAAYATRSLPLAIALPLNAPFTSSAPVFVAITLQLENAGSADSACFGGSVVSGSGIVTFLPGAGLMPWLADSNGPSKSHAPTCPSNDGAIRSDAGAGSVFAASAIASPAL